MILEAFQKEVVSAYKGLNTAVNNSSVMTNTNRQSSMNRNTAAHPFTVTHTHQLHISLTHKAPTILKLTTVCTQKIHKQTE